MPAEIHRDPKAGSGPKKKEAETRIHGEFEGVIPSGGAQLDFDVKGKRTEGSQPKA
jgi:hypothetical protein